MLDLHSEIIDYFDLQITNDKIRHLYLLTGEKGIGKKTLAKSIAKKLLCTSNEPKLPCGSCLSCRTFEAGTNADFLLVQNDDKNILISESRRILDELSLKPINSKRKVVVIVDVQKLTVQAENSILKAFEEPPAYAVIIMTCTDKDVLLETIVSRAIHFGLKPQKTDTIRDHVKNATPFSIRYGNGNIGRTIESQLDEFENTRQKALSLIEYIISSNTVEVNEKEFINDIESYLSIILLLLRDMLMIKVGSKKIINVDLEKVLTRLAKKTEYEYILELIQKAKRANELLAFNTNKRVVFNNFVFGIQGGNN